MRLARAEQSCATLTMPKKRASDTIRLATVQCTKKKEHQRGGHNSHDDGSNATADNVKSERNSKSPNLARLCRTDALDAIGADVDQRAKKTQGRPRE